MATYGPPPGTELKVYSSTFQPAQNLMIYDSGTWKQVTEGYVYVGGSNPWRKVWQETTPATVTTNTPYTKFTLYAGAFATTNTIYGFSVNTLSTNVGTVLQTSGAYKIESLYTILMWTNGLVRMTIDGNVTSVNFSGTTLNVYFHGDGSSWSSTNWFSNETLFVNDPTTFTAYVITDTTLRNKLISTATATNKDVSIYITGPNWPAPNL